MKQDIIIEEITYPSGGVLQVYKSGKTNYKPSDKYYNLLNSLKVKVNMTRTQRTIAHNRKKLLFEKNICPTSDRFIDRIFSQQTVFDFTKEVLKRTR